MPDTQHVTILLVEDDPGHARLIERNLRRAGITNEIITLTAGYTTIGYLLGTGQRRPLPLLILLDLHLPGLSGVQILEHLKAEKTTQHRLAEAKRQAEAALQETMAAPSPLRAHRVAVQR